MFKIKIYVGIAIIVVLGMVTMGYIYRGLNNVTGYLATLNSVSVPFSVAALEMEKNLGEYIDGMLRYISDPDPAVRAETVHDIGDFDRRYIVYQELGTSDRERELGRHVASEFKKLTAQGDALMEQRDHLDAIFQQSTDRLEQVDELLDGPMLEAAPAAQPQRNTTIVALQNIEAETAEIGFWLTLFKNRPKAQARQRVLQKIDEQHAAVEQYLALPRVSDRERQLANEVQALHIEIAKNIHTLLAGETAISQRAGELEQLAERIDDVFDNDIQTLLLQDLSEPKAKADTAIRQVKNTLRYIIPLYFLVALVVGILLIIAVIRPLKRLASGTEAIGRGNLDHRIDASGNDEFAKLARQFNRMTERLQKSTVSRARLEASEQQLKETVAELRQEIAERQQAERERAQLQTRLQRTESMATMGRLVAGVAHEVRNPLFGITSTLDAMEAMAEAGSAAPNPEYREVLRREVNRLNNLMTELLEYGRMPQADSTVESLARNVTEAVRHCQAAAREAGVDMVSELTRDARVAMHYDRLLQVFVNLIENAIQYSPQGGQVRVSTAPDRDESGSEWIACSVMDAGSGFAPEDVPHVFEPFFTRRRKGTGLGLAIVQRVVDEHQGTIEPGNRAEGGAVVTVRLPVADDKV